MTDAVIIALEAIAFLFFLGSALLGLLVFKQTRHFTQVWLMPLLGYAALVLFSFATVLEWFGIAPDLMDVGVQPFAMGIAITFFICFYLMTFEDWFRPFSFD